MTLKWYSDKLKLRKSSCDWTKLRYIYMNGNAREISFLEKLLYLQFYSCWLFNDSVRCKNIHFQAEFIFWYRVLLFLIQKETSYQLVRYTVAHPIDGARAPVISPPCPTRTAAKSALVDSFFSTWCFLIPLWRPLHASRLFIPGFNMCFEWSEHPSFFPRVSSDVLTCRTSRFVGKQVCTADLCICKHNLYFPENSDCSSRR